MKFLFFILFPVIMGCSNFSASKNSKETTLSITELNPNKETALTRQNLEHLFKIYHLTPFLFTLQIQIQSYVKSHPFPVLTLNTTFADIPHKLLAELLHEEFYWWVYKNKEQMKKASLEIKSTFPEISNFKSRTYNEIIVTFLEFEALRNLLGAKEASSILLEFIHKDKIRPWYHQQVYSRYGALKDIIEKYKLFPDNK